VRRRPSRQRSRPDQRPATRQARPKPSGPKPMRGHQRGSQRTQQQRHQTSLRARPLDRRAQRQRTIPHGGRLDPRLCTVRRQLVGGVAGGRCDQATRPKRPKQHSKHQEHPGGLLLPVHPHSGLTVLDPPTNAKVSPPPPPPPPVASRFAVPLAHEVAGRSATAGSASSVLRIQQEEHRDDRGGGGFSGWHAMCRKWAYLKFRTRTDTDDLLLRRLSSTATSATRSSLARAPPSTRASPRSCTRHNG
jgi:hypothetical protein